MDAAGERAARTPRVVGLDRVRARAEPAGVLLFGLLAVALVAGNTGGYLQTTQGWTAVATLASAAVGLLLRRDVRVGATEVVMAVGLLAFTGWVALSLLWSPSATATMLEVQRNLAYVGVVVAGLVLVRGRTARHLLGGVLAGITLISLYALGTRLVPDQLGSFDSQAFGYRLSAPLTYWNGLGLFAVVGALVAAGFVARGRSYVGAALAGASLPILVCTSYFTFSRGGWVALAVGLVVIVLLDPRRLQFIAVTLPLAALAAAAVYAVSQKDGLTTPGATFAAAVADGHAAVAPILALCALSGVFAVVAVVGRRRLRVPAMIRGAFVVVLVAAAVAATATVWRVHGSPWELAERGWDGFVQPYGGIGPNLSDRLFQLSSGGRVDLWGVSWEGFLRDPVKGTGAGSFAQEWARERGDPTSSSTEGHSLYAEVLGELGVPGLVLLLAVLLAPVAAALRSRRESLVVPALGAYVAFLAHAGVDWDWELTGVGVAALLVGVAIVRSRRAPAVVPAVGRWAAVAATLLVGAIAFWGLAGAEALRSASAAIREGDTTEALDRLDRAAWWAPWSSAPAELRANLYLSERRPALAREAYRDAIAKDASNWLLWSALASVSEGPERERALARVEQLNPLSR